MKQQITKEQTICDFCQKADSYHKCLKCGKDVCWECKKTRGIEYNHAVYFAGSADGFYCTPCDVDLSESKTDPVHQAFVAIRQLRDERQAWEKGFRARQEAAERHLAEIRGGY